MMFHPLPRLAALALVAVPVLGCQPADRNAGQDAGTDDGAVEVVARDYAFDAPDTLPAGWTTVAFENHGQEPHFMMLTRLPEGRTESDYMGEVGPAFDSAWAALQAGASKADAGALIGRLLPEWYGEARVMGGPGLVSPGGSVRTTLDLEPGTYVMECYVKTADGRFHTGLGMHHQLVVTDSASGAAPPQGDLAVTLANDRLEGPATVPAGEHVVAVHFAEQPAVGLGNDVHVARLDSTASMDAITHWMDWMNIDGLESPAPVTFLGGTEEMPAGQTAYFTLELEPGRYAWVPEGGDPERATMFTVE